MKKQDVIDIATNNIFKYEGNPKKPATLRVKFITSSGIFFSMPPKTNDYRDNYVILHPAAARLNGNNACDFDIVVLEYEKITGIAFGEFY